ncbi:hypothetical protein JOB18_030957 [Solea senegalensis]|uniref:Secreted protein n=1 Tax=Solea senegalensis TaxID=28829 RepID=A0AAV6Q3T6_SOLSE|nr:hypothetical protein JOB18_030957 [Solea senegalensis]
MSSSFLLLCFCFPDLELQYLCSRLSPPPRRSLHYIHWAKTGKLGLRPHTSAFSVHLKGQCVKIQHINLQYHTFKDGWMLRLLL